MFGILDLGSGREKYFEDEHIPKQYLGVLDGIQLKNLFFLFRLLYMLLI
jgi:hypothetical protein